MDFMELLKLSVSNLFSYKVRSFLTMLGIIIGISSVIMMSSLGAGVKEYYWRFEQVGSIKF